MDNAVFKLSMFCKLSLLLLFLSIVQGCKATPVVLEQEACLTTSSDPMLDISRLSSCQYNGSGPEGVCISAAVAPATQVKRLASCGNNMVCIPKKMAMYGTRLLPKKCESMIGLEGRCMSLLLPEVKDQEAFLPQDICDDDERCSPCYDPQTGEDTNACTIAPKECGAGPESEPYVLECPYTGPPILDINNLAACADSPGTHCLAASRVPEDQQTRLTPCKGNDDVDGFCAPDKSIQAGNMYVPPSCRTPDDLEGRCMPQSLPTIKEQDYGIWQMDCPDGELCAPCYDPKTGEDTGSCRAAPCDSPKEPPGTTVCPYDGPPLVHLDMLQECDSANTHCAPERLVPEDQRSMLSPCVDGYCVPDNILLRGGNYVNKCRALYGMFEGRCQSVALPSVAEKSDLLTQESCPDGELCAPCYDSITGEDTQACRSAPCDQPDEEKKIFEYCFENKARCVPSEIVPEADRGDLLQRTCPGGTLCVPNELVEDPEYLFPSCTTGGQPAACVPEAVGSIDLIRATIVQESCPENHLCVPCEINLLIYNLSTNACEKLAAKRP